jgi:hydrogenase maturation protein HypF
MAALHLERAGLPVPWERWQLVRESLKVNAPLSSGMGRLFDAVAAVLRVREEVTYEGQAAIELEWLAGRTEAEPYDWQLGNPTALVTDCCLDLREGRAAAARACAEAAEPSTVVLSGGTFQNLRLLESARRRLEAKGFRVLSHERVPPNDGGISYGQASVAAARTAGRH